MVQHSLPCRVDKLCWSIIQQQNCRAKRTFNRDTCPTTTHTSIAFHNERINIHSLTRYFPPPKICTSLFHVTLDTHTIHRIMNIICHLQFASVNPSAKRCWHSRVVGLICRRPQMLHPGIGVCIFSHRHVTQRNMSGCTHRNMHTISHTHKKKKQCNMQSAELHAESPPGSTALHAHHWAHVCVLVFMSVTPNDTRQVEIMCVRMLLWCRVHRKRMRILSTYEQ